MSGGSSRQEASAPLIRLTGVTKVYGSGQAAMHALRGIDLEIEAGDFVAVMGPSGSGKSTVMNILGCLDTPSAGSYWFQGIGVGGLDRNQRARLRRHYLGFVFQGFNLLSRTSALENVELPLVYRGIPAAERHARARGACAAVGLSGWEDHTPAELSGGQQQRVAIARAIVTRPAVLLADEPTGNLDTARSREIMELLGGFNRDLGITIVMVTHDATMATYARRIVRCIDGRIAADARNRGGGLMVWNALRLAVREIRRNVLRSSLTILGIVIGVAAVIVMVTIGGGATVQVTQQIASLGSNLLMVRPGQLRHGPSAATNVRLFDLADAVALARDIPQLGAVAPSSSQRVTAIFGNTNWATSVIGTTNAFFRARDWVVPRGRQFTEGELRGGKAVCILGDTVRQELFARQDPLGSKIRLHTLSCEVVGLLEAKGQTAMGSDQDDLVIIPLRAFQRRIAGNQDIGMLQVSVREGGSTEGAKRAIEELMRERRHIARGEEDDFSVMDMKEITRMLTGTTQVLTALLGAVAAVSLLVGGVGIMNIMLVSVTERTREIGIRLAIGALEREVLTQFLVEAVVLASFGGVFGTVLALAASAALADLLRVPFVFNPGIVILSLLFSAAVGVIFGYFPARKAARLDPIEALRHE